MNNNFSDDEIERIKNFLQNNQNVDANIEQLLAIILNPERSKTVRKNLTDFYGNAVAIAQTREGNVINSHGYPEEKKEEDVVVLDDGTTLCGITVCETCSGVVKEENIRRCPCGQTCCLRRGCAKYSKSKDEWYCSGWHKFLGELGFNLR